MSTARATLRARNARERILRPLGMKRATMPGRSTSSRRRAGSLSTGRDIVAALAMGADLAYMGTRFIPVRESLASEDYRSAL